ncbi:MAG: hypothetical protein K8S23_09645 [Candidatus Cloacimonetes bacterium]|nr:hypothetical protein [Candidatus Cloacimonadota bacterium]
MNDEFSKDIELSNEEKFEIIGKVKKRLEDDFVTLGQLLSEIKRTKAFRIKGYKTFKDFVEDEFQFSGAFASKMISNYELFIEELDINESSVKNIGLDKLNMIKSLVKDVSYEETEKWINKAETMPTADLREDIKQAKEKNKEVNLKDIFIDQFRERMVTFFNCSHKEMMFKLALYFQDQDLSEMKSEVKIKQRQFEDTNNSGGSIE